MAKVNKISAKILNRMKIYQILMPSPKKRKRRTRETKLRRKLMLLKMMILREFLTFGPKGVAMISMMRQTKISTMH